MPVEDLKSKEALKRICWALEVWRKERAVLDVEHTMISKYHERLWFQRSRFQSQAELMARYYQLAYILTSLDADIHQYEELIYKHSRATEELHTSMNPFDGIDLKEIPLVQTSMF